MTNRSQQYGNFWFSTVALLCAFVLPGSAQAALVSVNPTVTMNSGGGVHYNYAVTNDSAFALSVVTLSVPSSAAAIQNLVAPDGFSTNFDSRLGLLDFLENTGSFAARTTVSGFQFDSPFGPDLASFTAVALDASGGAVDFAGQTLAPKVAQVPEPSTFVLALPAGLLLLLVARRRSRKR